jgi:hypothetical protein
MNSDVLDKITMLKNSQRCLTFGLLAFLPGIGIPFAVMALWTAGRVRTFENRYWNAAGPYRIWGVVCAALGLIFWFSVVALIMLHAATSNGGSGWGDGGGGE